MSVSVGPVGWNPEKFSVDWRAADFFRGCFSGASGCGVVLMSSEERVCWRSGIAGLKSGVGAAFVWSLDGVGAVVWNSGQVLARQEFATLGR